MRKALLFLSLLAALTLPQHSYGGDSWNIAVPGEENISRSASASLFDGGASIFSALAARERLKFDSALELYAQAAEALGSASKELDVLSSLPPAATDIDVGDSDIPPEALALLGNWYGQHGGTLEVPSLAGVKISNLLQAASKEAGQLATMLQSDEFRSAREIDPERARAIIDRYSWFITAGTVASQAFAITLSRHPLPK
ncbi:hypothetical protein J5277_16455 [Rhizobium sp. 16-449-1b]|uniref:hypothetical protein n=1 Tax=Rhizobium sp. 16-449-1b TaxID=2819989 RepID=UPI001ADC1D4E|nr:hypothetical protein [Rhizobium sp. 16-449-1b]MBO9195699.1 hypothetical protein [Rhizobium sp. 16-449-1b]